MTAAEARYRSRAVLEIVGAPHAELLIHRHGHDPWSAIFIGQIPSGGRLRLKVPRGHLVIVAPGCAPAQAQFVAGIDYLKLELVRS